MTPLEYLSEKMLYMALIDYQSLSNLMMNYHKSELKAAIIAAVKHGIENCEDKGDKWNDAAAERYYNENYGS